jgi:hypothetical protein
MRWKAANDARTARRDRRAEMLRYALERGLPLKRAAGVVGVSYRTARRYRAEAR